MSKEDQNIGVIPSKPILKNASIACIYIVFHSMQIPLINMTNCVYLCRMLMKFHTIVVRIFKQSSLIYSRVIDCFYPCGLTVILFVAFSMQIGKGQPN